MNGITLTSEVSYGIAFLVSAIGVYGIATSRNLLRTLLSIEVLFNGILLAIVTFLSQIAVLDTLASVVIVSVVSGEVIVMVAVIVSFYRVAKTLDSSSLEEEGV